MIKTILLVFDLRKKLNYVLLFVKLFANINIEAVIFIKSQSFMI